MIKKLDIPNKVKFQNFIKGMGVSHFHETAFTDVPKNYLNRVLNRYTKYPNIHVEDFDVKIAVNPICDQDELPENLKERLKFKKGTMFHLHVEITENKKLMDFFEMMEFVPEEIEDGYESLYALYSNSDTREESDFE